MFLIFSLIKCLCKYEWEMIDKYPKYYSLETDIYKWLDYLSPFSALWPWASLVAQLVKNLPEVQETQVWFLHPEDLLEKG